MRGPRLLPRPLALHDVRDFEAHVRALIDARLSEWGARLTPELHEDLLAYLLGVGWELSLRYQPGPDLTFSTYSRRILRARVVDWYRSTFHDARYVQNVTEVSLYAFTEVDEEETTFLERHDGHRDELNRHASRDHLEEVLTRASLPG